MLSHPPPSTNAPQQAQLDAEREKRLAQNRGEKVKDKKKKSSHKKHKHKKHGKESK